MSLKVMVCTPIPNEDGPHGKRPCKPTFEWMKGRLDLVTPLTTTIISRWEIGQTVDNARNAAAQAAIDQGMDFLFFLDWDVIPQPQSLHMLVQRALNNPDCDVFSGVYCCRTLDYPAPLLYVTDDFKLTWDWTVGDVLTTQEDDLTGFGCGMMLIRTSLLQKMEPPWFVTNHYADGGGETEDLYFLKNAKKEGANFLVDTSLLAWHIDPDTGVAANLPHDSLPVKRWRESDETIPPNAVPYNRHGLFLINVGQHIINGQKEP